MTDSKFQKLVNNRFLFRMYLLRYLPMAFIAGVRATELTNEKAVTTIKFGWLTQNPFHSIYFACQAMAAEMSTGLLVMNSTYQSTPPISMLIVKNQAVYLKKAIGEITFTCNDGKQIDELIVKSNNSEDGIVLDLTSIGIDETGEKVAGFIFTWSLKAKK